MTTSRAVAFTILTTLLLAAGTGQADTPPESRPVRIAPEEQPQLLLPATNPATADLVDPAPDDPWRFLIAPYFWVPDLDATITTGDGGGGGPGLPWYEIFDVHTDFGLWGVNLLTEVWWKRFGFVVDTTYANLNWDLATGRILEASGTANLQVAMIDSTPAVRVFAWDEANSPRNAHIDLLAGARVFWLADRISLRFPNRPDLNGTADQQAAWAEILVGAQGAIQVLDWLRFQLRADIAGFHWNPANDLSWRVRPIAEFVFSPNWGLVAGWQVAGLDAVLGTGQDRIAIRGVLQGPVFGMTARF